MVCPTTFRGAESSFMPNYDAIIAGAGHNGLVTAAYLARAGKKVLVLEGRELVGGCSVTEEIWPGFRVSTAAYLTSLMQEKIVRELELERYGYKVDAKDPAFFSVFPDGRHFFMWQDRAKTLAEIAKFSKRDAERYPAYEDTWNVCRRSSNGCCSLRRRIFRPSASATISNT